MGFQTVLLSAVTLLAFAIPGFFLRKFKVFDGKSVKVLVALLVFVAQPAMVGENILKQKFSAELGANLLKTISIYVLMIVLIFVAGALIFKQRRKKANLSCAEITSTRDICTGACNASAVGDTINTDINADVDNDLHRQFGGKIDGKGNSDSPAASLLDNSSVESDNTALQKTKKIDENNRIYRFASVFGNNGYFGLPLIALLFPGNTTMLLYASLCVILFNILTWTVGIYMLTGDKKYMSIKKGLLLPVPIVAALTLPFFFIKSLTIPAPILTFANGLGAMTTPLSMLIMGARLAEIPLKEIFADRKVYIVSVLRLIAAPALTFCILKLTGITDTDLFNTLMIVSLVPSSVTTIVLSEKFLTSSYTAVKTVLLTTILCIITIPLICAFFLI